MSSLVPLPDCHLQLLRPAPLALQPAAHIAKLGLEPLGLGLLHREEVVSCSVLFNYEYFDTCRYHSCNMQYAMDVHRKLIDFSSDSKLEVEM